MIRSLTGKDGVTAYKLNDLNWIIAGPGPRLDQFDSELSALKARIDAIQIPDFQKAIDDLRASFLLTQQFNTQQLIDLDANSLGHGLANVNFGAFPGATEATAAVVNPNITTSSIITVWPLIFASVDHTPNEVSFEEFHCEVATVAAGSFSVLVRPRVGLSFGVYPLIYLYL